MNKVILIGRLTKDPELKYLPGTGTAVTKVIIAVDNYNSKTKESGADFIPITFWNKKAENVANYLSKGSQIAIVGRIRTGSYDKEGKKYYTTEVVVDDDLEFVGNKKESNKNNLDGMEPVTEEAESMWR